jgi:hypothetical protein
MSQKPTPALELVVSRGGNVRAIYSDALAETLSEFCDEAQITRVSHVEPTPSGKWIADMSPAVLLLGIEVDNPILGPFSLRGQALDAEIEWLRERL